MFKTFSGASLTLIALLLFLQFIPITGIFLMILGAPAWTGLLVHVFLLALAIEAWLGRIQRALIVIPIVAYGGYYALYISQTVDMMRTAAQLRSTNSAKVLDFNPDTYSLVTPVASTLVQTHDIPVAYSTDEYTLPERYVSLRLIPRDRCRVPRDSLNRIQAFGASTHDWGRTPPCVLRFPQYPPNKIVSVAKIGDEEIARRKREIGTQTSQVIANGVVLGTYKTASIWRLPRFPWLVIGCGLDSGASAWRCQADFTRTLTVLDTVPDGIDRKRFDGPESVMLGISKYSESDFAKFRPHPSNEAVYGDLQDEPKRVEDRMFTLLKELAEGGNPNVPVGIGYTVSLNPTRLAPLADAMANRFIELANDTRGGGQEYLYRFEGLAKALESLPDDTFKRIAIPLRVHFVEDMSIDKFRELKSKILRLSDPAPADFHETDFAATRGLRRLPPILALCRNGRASPWMIGEMKVELLRESADAQPNDDYKTALIVTLLKFGESAFIEGNRSRLSPNAPADLDGWLNAVLSGKGTTKLGPNNCQTKVWNWWRVHKPSLKLMDGNWIVASN